MANALSEEAPTFGPAQKAIIRLIESVWWRHGSLDGQGSHVLPSLLEEGDEVVDGQHDVGDELILSHANVTDGDTHAENLLKLELDGGLDVVDLALEVLVVRDWGWELSGLGETWTEETWNLLDQSIGSDESIVLACELLDELLVLVELLQVIGGHGVNTTVLGAIDIVLVTENAGRMLVYALRDRSRRGFVPDAHVWAWDLWKTDGSRETLISLWVVVLETNLELDGLQKVALLGLEGVVQELLNVGAHSGCKEESSANRSFALSWSAANCALMRLWLASILRVHTDRDLRGHDRKSSNR